MERWATHQLAEFLAVVSSVPDERSAAQVAVERAAEALEAEAGAIVDGEAVVASIGFPQGDVPAAELARLAREPHGTMSVEGVGRCSTVSVPLEKDSGGQLLLARAGEDGFSQEEANLLRAMGKVLTLTKRIVQGLHEERALRASLQERQALLERLATIQRSIVRRAELSDVLDSVVTGARDLLGDEVVGIRLLSEGDRMELVASVGMDRELTEALRHGRVGQGAGGRAISERRLVVMEDYQHDPAALSPLAATHLQSAMAAPVHRNGVVCGSLVVASHKPGRSYSDAEKEVLLAFAEHASIAITDARNFAEALHRALHDSLTDLPNRELFADRLEQALRRARRDGTLVGVLFLDLDGFKLVNDSLGHGVGDKLLTAVAERLEELLLPGDSAARFGGDEFAVLLDGLPHPGQAEDTAQRIVEAFAAPFRVGEQEIYVTASIGVACGREPQDDLLRNADLAMYRAKSRGKDRYEAFEQSMHAAVVERVALERDLQRALEKDELCLHYQPIVSLRTGRLVAVEALVRWRHPERGLLLPGEFIPIAEESRLIIPIGRWVLREACRQASIWREQRPALAMCVNLSSVQLGQAELCTEVEDAIRDARFDARSLILEITETVLMRDVEATVAHLRSLKELGVQLAVDDFGTGYSSLQYLRGFPIDILKIAKSFIDGVAGASDESALARAIIELGDSFQLRVVAEGIEREDQLERLLQLGCELGQGYLFAKPMEASELEAMSVMGADARQRVLLRNPAA